MTFKVLTQGTETARRPYLHFRYLYGGRVHVLHLFTATQNVGQNREMGPEAPTGQPRHG